MEQLTILLTKLMFGIFFSVPVVSLSLAYVSFFASRPWGVTIGICIAIVWCFFSFIYSVFKVILFTPKGGK